ncbi:MAG: MerR family transcriptional regulator, partial [Acidimicrobiales bacterium]
HEELAAASGLTPEHVADLRSQGLIAPEVIGGSEIYDADALSVARLASRFAAFGVEARHLRLYKNAAEREAGFVEQVILPFVRQRNPEARAQARQTSADLLRLGRELREVLVDRALRDLLRRR